MIAVVISARTEWRCVTDYYAVTPADATPFGQWFSRSIQEQEVGFFFEGWGKINAAAATQHILDVYAPEFVINLGTCGGFAGHAQVGDILLAEKTIVYDIDERMFDPDDAIRAYSADLDVAWFRDWNGVNVIKTILVSADRDLDPADVHRLHTQYQAIAGDWESGAIAHVCQRNRVPVVILRGVSDLVSHRAGEAYADGALFTERTSGIMRTLLKLLPNIITLHQTYRDCHEHCTRNIPATG